MVSPNLNADMTVGRRDRNFLLSMRSDIKQIKILNDRKSVWPSRLYPLEAVGGGNTLKEIIRCHSTNSQKIATTVMHPVSRYNLKY